MVLLALNLCQCTFAYQLCDQSFTHTAAHWGLIIHLYLSRFPTTVPLPPLISDLNLSSNHATSHYRPLLFLPHPQQQLPIMQQELGLHTRSLGAAFHQDISHTENHVCFIFLLSPTKNKPSPPCSRLFTPTEYTSRRTGLSRHVAQQFFS